MENASRPGETLINSPEGINKIIEGFNKSELSKAQRAICPIFVVYEIGEESKEEDEVVIKAGQEEAKSSLENSLEISVLSKVDQISEMLSEIIKP